MTISTTVSVLMILFSIGLFSISGYLLLRNQIRAAVLSLSFFSLLLILLTISNYKHINGFGFEAEMWDTKQQEAADLVQKLRNFALVTGTQVSMITSQIGYMGNSISNLEIMDYVTNLKAQAVSLKIIASDQEKMVAPLYRRIEENYEEAIRFAVQKKYEEFVRFVNSGPANTPQKMADVNESNTITNLLFFTYKPLELEEWTKRMNEVLARKPFKNDPAFTEKISSLQQDLAYFEKNHTLRRQIDVRESVP